MKSVMRFRVKLMILKYLSILLLSTQASFSLATAPTIKDRAAETGGSNSQYLHDMAFEMKKVSFPNGSLILHGVVYKPKGTGPLPSILFNHGSSLETHVLTAA